MLRVLTLATLFPDATRPNFGVFVERQTLGLASHPDVDLQVVAPIGLPPFPLTLAGRHRALAALPRSEIWQGLTVRRPRFLALPATGGRFHASLLTRALLPLVRGLREEFAFDVIDASFFFPDGPAAIALGGEFGVPVSLKARGADIHHWGHAPATAGQVRTAGAAADGLLAVSRAMRDDMAAIGLPRDRIRVHHTGVDLDRFAPVDRAAARTALDVAGPLIVSVGALIERKGHGVVIEALRDLPDATLIIAGEGPTRPALRALADRLGVAGRVRLLGAVPNGELLGLIAAADVMALASSSEGLANAWIEALACGTPIVITPAGGAAEVVTAQAFGRIAERTPAAFARAIAALLGAPPAADAVRQGALRFTWAANTAALYDHLAGLVAARRAG